MDDAYPQGKDLYDAVLLAEHTVPSLSDLRAVMRPELGRVLDEFVEDELLALPVDWANFQAEYPAMTGDAAPWLRRLAELLSR